MKKIIPVIAVILLVISGCNNGSNKKVSSLDKTSKDYVVGIDTKGDTLTLEDIENSIDSLNYYLKMNE